MLADLPAPARALADYMSELSEQAYSAAWMEALEFQLWAALQGEMPQYGRLKFLPQHLQQLGELSRHCGGWIVFHDDTQETWLPLQDWQAAYASWRAGQVRG